MIQDGLNEELENMIDFSDRGQFQEGEIHGLQSEIETANNILKTLFAICFSLK